MKQTYQTLVIGTGCGGFNAANRLWDLGVRDIAIVTEGRKMGTSRNTGSDKQTYYKLSLCGSDGDSVRRMAQTLYEGGRVNGDTALAEAAYSVRGFMNLVELGVPFPANEYGEYVGYKTDHDPLQRGTSCGPLTSKYMTEALEAAAKKRRIEVLDHLRVIRILTDGNSVTGIAAADTRTGELTVLGCGNVILATGGPAGIYRDSVYPVSQTGGTGTAIEAGAACVNLEEWQYGLASVAFRWNLSGTYQQVLPRYISVAPDGTEREFLWDALKEESLDRIFLKGYQWPFDTRKTDGSSRIDLLTAEQIKAGNRVYLDYTHNPRGLETGFGGLSEEAYTYLERSGALFGTPIERLYKMNRGAIDLYRAHGIDLWRDRLEIAVCAQHCNGGVDVDANWESCVRGLYVVGEAAGTFGAYRPGGSALNSTQVGSLRAAEQIARSGGSAPQTVPEYTMPQVRIAKSSDVRRTLAAVRGEMSRCADFEREIPKMRALSEKLNDLREHFFDRVQIRDRWETADLFRLHDTVLTQCAVLSAMICSAETIGTHGSALVRGSDAKDRERMQSTQTVTQGGRSFLRPVRPMPNPELWFETVLAEQYRRNQAAQTEQKEREERKGSLSIVGVEKN